MKTILQLLIAALVINGCVRAAESAWRHYQLVDAIEQTTRLGDNRTTSQLRKRVLELADGYGVALESADVTIGTSRQDTSVSFQYIDAIPLIPRAYTREHVYEVDITVQPLRPVVDDETRR